jgi:hypothetical protein
MPIDVRPTAGRMNYLDLIGRWAWVGIPLAWGVWQTVRTSLALFQ